MFEYLHYGLALVLIFVGTKMLLSRYYQIPTAWALATVGGILLLSIAASARRERK
jgi:tellurite resistance protein TerC